MAEVGLFNDERVELIRGIIVRMSPQNARHSVVIQLLTRLLVPPLLGRADVRVQLPFAASDDSMPEPDLAVVAVARFGQAHPNKAFLIIEVADSSLEVDRTEKAEVYATAGVPEYWIVNLPDQEIEVRRESSRGVYSSVVRFPIGQQVSPTVFPDVVVAVRELFATSG